MAIWLGYGGGLRIDRKEPCQLYGVVEHGDVDPGQNRFGVDGVKSFITGDRVWVRRVDENGRPVTDLLEFIDASGWGDNAQHEDGQWYVHVNALGNIRLYHSWADSLTGSSTKAVQLHQTGLPMRISMQTTQTAGARCLAQTKSWELNTNRDTADITSLGDSFRKNMAVTISGSGQVEAIFDALPDACGDDMGYEWSVYLHELILRQQIGATFTGVFLLKRQGTLPITVDQRYREQELFYTCDCVITEVASAVDTENYISSNISFVTTGEVKLIYSQPWLYLLQEQPPNDKVLQESGFGIALETFD